MNTTAFYKQIMKIECGDSCNSNCVENQVSEGSEGGSQVLKGDMTNNEDLTENYRHIRHSSMPTVLHINR